MRRFVHEELTDRAIRVLWNVESDPFHWQERQRQTPKAHQGRLKTLRALADKGLVELKGEVWMTTVEGRSVLQEIATEAFGMYLEVRSQVLRQRWGDIHRRKYDREKGYV